MAIKINGKDLQKRIINGKEVEKVMLNGVQIWPETTPPVADDYLCFTAEESNSTVKLREYSGGGITTVLLETSTDKTTWNDYTIGDTITLSSIGDKVYFRNKSETQTGFSSSIGGFYYFSMTGSISGSGDVGSLLCKNSTSTMTAGCFRRLFANCTSLINPPSLPATTMGYRCYMEMFNGCTNLTTAPQLPATTLAGYCYERMFVYCLSLVTAPQLPATTLVGKCYVSMFSGCRNLTTAPQLSATTLAAGCYEDMFSGCTSLTIAPNLPATSLYAECYQNMFSGCTALTTPPALPATHLVGGSGGGCYDEMFSGCTSLNKLPALPATHLQTECYYYMFYGCTSIKLSETQTGEYQTPYTIPSSGTGVDGTKSLQGMFEDTGGTFTGTPNINQTYYTSNIVV